MWWWWCLLEFCLFVEFHVEFWLRREAVCFYIQEFAYKKSVTFGWAIAICWESIRLRRRQQLRCDLRRPDESTRGKRVLNFAEQTGSGAVIFVWSFSSKWAKFRFLKILFTTNNIRGSLRLIHHHKASAFWPRGKRKSLIHLISQLMFVHLHNH